MKFKHLLLVAGLVFALSQTASAQPGPADPATEADLVKSVLKLDCDPVFLGKWDFDGFLNGEAQWDKEGPYSSQFVIDLGNNGLLSGDWSLTDPYDLGGYDVVAWVVKAGLSSDVVANTEPLTSGSWKTSGQDLSHISFFGCETKSVPEPASVLAGLMALGLGVAGRKYLA